MLSAARDGQTETEYKGTEFSFIIRIVPAAEQVRRGVSVNPPEVLSAELIIKTLEETWALGASRPTDVRILFSLRFLRARRRWRPAVLTTPKLWKCVSFSGIKDIHLESYVTCTPPRLRSPSDYHREFRPHLIKSFASALQHPGARPSEPHGTPRRSRTRSSSLRSLYCLLGR